MPDPEEPLQYVSRMLRRCRDFSGRRVAFYERPTILRRANIRRVVMRRSGFLVYALAGMFVLQAAAATVTFHEQIAPIVYKNCSPCHRPGEAAPFPLLSYSDAKRHAAQIAAVTKRRFMPPWLPEPSHGEFLDERRLSDTEIDLIQQWVQQ